MLDKNQRIVADSYDGGEFNYVQGVADAGRKLGDGLFNFLLIELSHAEDCDSIEAAIKRLETIRRQLEEVRGGFESARDRGKTYHHAFSINFPVYSDNKAKDVTGKELMAAMANQFTRLCRHTDGAIKDECEDICDTYEQESGDG